MADARYFDHLYSGYSGPPQGWGIGKDSGIWEEDEESAPLPPPADLARMHSDMIDNDEELVDMLKKAAAAERTAAEKAEKAEKAASEERSRWWRRFKGGRRRGYTHRHKRRKRHSGTKKRKRPMKRISKKGTYRKSRRTYRRH